MATAYATSATQKSDTPVESGTGAPTLGSGGNSDAFATGLSPAPIITFPVPAHRTQRANFQHWALQWDHAPRTQMTGAAATTTCRPSGSPMTCVEDARRPPLATLHSRSAIKPAYASMTPLRSTKLRRPKRPFTYACDASGICGTHRGHRHCRSRRLSPFSHPSSPEAPFLDRHYPASSVVRASPPPLPARPDPCGLPVDACTSPTGLPVLPPSPSSMRAAATTPAEPVGARVALFPTDGSLPRYSGGSASALPVSRPAQRSLTLRPAWLLSHPRRPVTSKCFSRSRYLLQPLRLLPAGATVAGRGSHPPRDSAFSTAH